MSETLKAPNIRELSLPLGGAAICRCGVADGWLNGSKILRIAPSNSIVLAAKHPHGGDPGKPFFFHESLCQGYQNCVTPHNVWSPLPFKNRADHE